MKKILILLLVFGISSLANAGVLSLEVYVDGSPYVEATPVTGGAAVDVYLVQDAEDTLGSGGEVWVTFSGASGAATDLSDTIGVDLYGGWDWLSNAGVSMLDASTFWMGKVANLGIGTPGLGSLMGHSAMPAASRETYTVLNSTALLSFAYVDPTLVEFDQGTWDGALVDGSVQVGVPEPMTIALLGLGGLFLRRRK